MYVCKFTYILRPNQVHPLFLLCQHIAKKIKINYFRRAAKPHPTPPCNGLIFCGKFTKIVPNEERIYYYY